MPCAVGAKYLRVYIMGFCPTIYLTPHTLYFPCVSLHLSSFPLLTPCGANLISLKVNSSLRDFQKDQYIAPILGQEFLVLVAALHGLLNKTVSRAFPPLAVTIINVTMPIINKVELFDALTYLSLI